ncbi:MAG: porin family protein [Methylococcaceae bacterium]|nr:porin family protein [Methylococcaceae bacterium]
MKKTKLALTAIVAFAAATVATGAVAAHEGTKAHKHGHAGHVETTETHSSSFSHSSSNAKVDALEAQLQSMQAEIRSLRAASGHHVDPDTAKVQELDQWMTSVKHEGHSSKDSKDNMVFFRGGYGYNVDKRGGTLDPTNANGVGTINGAISNRDAWYFGAGFDFSVNDNLFGMMQGTEVLAELMFDYKQLGERKANGLTAGVTTLIPAASTALGGGGVNSQTATVNSLSLAASPKIKFLKGHNFRPWLIPAGFELSIISPPSDAITVLNPGMMFGAGADYKIWKDIYAGADVRWHQSFDNLDGINTNGLTAGGYLGLGF